jgi:hypothetical protein
LQQPKKTAWFQLFREYSRLDRFQAKIFRQADLESFASRLDALFALGHEPSNAAAKSAASCLGLPS